MLRPKFFRTCIPKLSASHVRFFHLVWGFDRHKLCWVGKCWVGILFFDPWIGRISFLAVLYSWEDEQVSVIDWINGWAGEGGGSNKVVMKTRASSSLRQDYPWDEPPSSHFWTLLVLSAHCNRLNTVEPVLNGQFGMWRCRVSHNAQLLFGTATTTMIRLRSLQT